MSPFLCAAMRRLRRSYGRVVTPVFSLLSFTLTSTNRKASKACPVCQIVSPTILMISGTTDSRRCLRVAAQIGDMASRSARVARGMLDGLHANISVSQKRKTRSTPRYGDIPNHGVVPIRHGITSKLRHKRAASRTLLTHTRGLRQPKVYHSFAHEPLCTQVAPSQAEKQTATSDCTRLHMDGGEGIQESTASETAKDKNGQMVSHTLAFRRWISRCATHDFK